MCKSERWSFGNHRVELSTPIADILSDCFPIAQEFQGFSYGPAVAPSVSERPGQISLTRENRNPDDQNCIHCRVLQERAPNSGWRIWAAAGADAAACREPAEFSIVTAGAALTCWGKG